MEGEVDRISLSVSVNCTRYNEMWYDMIVVPRPSVCAVPARRREARKRNLSIASNPVSLRT